jgi:bestrophin, other
MTRWWNQYLTIPWPYAIAVYVSSTIQGYDEVGRAIRRTIMRYTCLSLTMVFRVLSPRVTKRFPKMADLVDAGLLTQNELTIIEDLERKFPGYSKNWLPICWAASLVNRARDEGRIRDDFAVKTLIDELNKFRGSCGTLLSYDTICIPLVYLQVVTIAVYTYFLTALITEQYTREEGSVKYKISYLPDLITLQFIFYMGWLKVAETMMNPFGDDDDDFEVNYMIDRNLQMSYLIVDEMHNEHPELLKDQYWNEIPTTLLDRGKDENVKEDKPKEKTDIFDIVKDQRISTLNAMTEVVEEGSKTNVGENQNQRQSGLNEKKVDPDLIPRADVISSPSAFKMQTLFKAKSVFERQLQTIREKKTDEDLVKIEDATDDATEDTSDEDNRSDIKKWSLNY